MKRILTFAIILIALTACTAPQTQAASEPAMTDMPQAGMPNPASVYCTQNGNKLEIRTTADGGQNGICIFPDGSTCDEWAYYRGECGPAAQKSPTPAMTVEATIEASGGTEEQASGGYMPPGTTEEIADWWGVIKSTQPGAQYDDYFVPIIIRKEHFPKRSETPFMQIINQDETKEPAWKRLHG